MNETVYLSDAESPLRIEYSRAAMEEIRQRAREGLMAAPRVGMGVGGLLLGVRENGRIRLLDSIEIPCSHSGGPSFTLTADEKREGQAMIAEVGAASVSGKVNVIGWYCSKTRGYATLNESDLNLYAEWFPDSWHIALVVRPSAAEPMRAAFFFRDENGGVVKGVESDVDEWWSGPSPETAGEVEPEPELAVTHAEPVEAPKVLPKPAPPHVVEIRPPTPRVAEMPEPVEPALPVAIVPVPIARPAGTMLSDIVEIASPVAASDAVETPVRPRVPSFGYSNLVPTRPTRKKRPNLLWVLGTAAAIAIGAGGYVSRDFWMPKPALTLTSTELNGTLLIKWNPEALRGINHASMFVNDGGQPTPSVITLDRFQLNSGLLSYTPKSERVTAKLDAGETSAITAWFAPTPVPAPTAAPAPAATGDALSGVAPNNSNDSKDKK
jgi:hypothetical protein